MHTGMLIIGLILLIAGYLLGVGLLVTIGWVVFIIGLILMLLSFVPSGPLAGRRYY